MNCTQLFEVFNNPSLLCKQIDFHTAYIILFKFVGFECLLQVDVKKMSGLVKRQT